MAQKKIICLMQARMGSTRLPGKVLRLISDKPMLWHDLQRVKKTKSLTNTVVVTTDLPADNLITDYCESWEIPYFCGSELNVLDRYYQAANAFKADIIVRVTSDCPLICPALIDQVIQTLINDNSLDYAAIGKGYPRGLNAEAFTMQSFEKVHKHAEADYEQVHVTPHYYLNPKKFNIKIIERDAPEDDMRWTVDTPEDIKMVRAVYAAYNARPPLIWQEIRDFMIKNPNIAAINSEIKQKKLREL